ncbi:hypothetical protein HCJ66_11430 [Listeria sp. FSL L7-1582]|uniref:hypothetical protein n=1 Tax=Listeria portnoyi TaxID=2713504 RepID=UPI00164D2C60|nr:hypothetical protein [Listeria portnoyi]MBC6310149.1 hypothetical protein [Listeria portnoyi]
MRLPESLQQLNNLPLGKITEVNETNSMRASNTLLISIRTFQVQLYVSLDDDLELLDDALKRGLEPYGYYSGYCEGYPHPDWKTVYVKTIQYKKTKYY